MFRKVCYLAATLAISFVLGCTSVAEIVDTDEDSVTILYQSAVLETEVDRQKLQTEADRACGLHKRKAVLVSNRGTCHGQPGWFGQCTLYRFVFSCVKVEEDG